MPIINTSPVVGTKLRYTGPVKGFEQYISRFFTVGRIYVIAGELHSGAVYVYDDEGDRNFACGPDGGGIFELLSG